MGKLVFASMALAAVASAQQPVAVLDAYIVKIKPERRAEYDALVKKMADANRKNKGYNWTAAEVMYGEQNTIYFTAGVPNLAAVDEGETAFMTAITKALGPAGMQKLTDDANKCLVSARGELRRVRNELSSNFDPATLYSTVGKGRFVRVTMVRVRPGRNLEYEGQVRMTKAAYERDHRNLVSLVSQSMAGQNATIYYHAVFGKSLGSFDGVPTLPRLLGDDGYMRFVKMSSENLLGTETIINRYLPELSNPPEQAVNADPDFWKPKPPPAKPKPATSGN